MLVHIVCWKYKESATEAERTEHRESLVRLRPLISAIRSFDVGADILHLDRSFDTGLVATFDDRRGLDAYTIHDEHQKVASFGKSISEQVISVDFENA